MYFKKSHVIKLLILTDFNVSNVHYMLAQCLREDHRFEPLFLDFSRDPQFYNDFNWFVNKPQDETFNLSRLFSRSSIIKKLWETIRLIKESDVVLTSGKVANLVSLCGKPYIYFSYGSDLDQYSKYGDCIFGIRGLSNIPFFRRYIKTFLINPVRRQLYRMAIRQADTTIIAQYQYKDISELGYKKLGFFPHPLETDFWNITLDDKKNNKNWIQTHYNCERILFSSTRHVWDKYYENASDFKGNNIIIEALNLYLKQTKDKSIKLFLIRKGQDVKLSENLIKEFGIEKHVIWLNQVPRKELIKFYSGADVFFDEFSKGCLALCAIEAMSCGTPTVSYIGKRIAEVPFYSESPYLLNTKEPAVISNYLIRLFSDNVFKQEEEKKTFEWIRNNCSCGTICNSFFHMAESIINR